MERLIGRYGRPKEGALLVCVAGLHGNEPAGVEACRRVCKALSERRPSMKGEWIALAGNLRALAVRRRYILRDLNRIWTEERIQHLLDGHVDADLLRAEEREQFELLQMLRSALQDQTRPTYFIDLHTTSAEGVPFAVVEDTLRNREFSFRFPIPVLLGFEEQVRGALAEHITETGCVSITLEGGQHESSEAVDNLEALIWTAFETLGLIESPPQQRIRQLQAQLQKKCAPVPCAFEVRYRHAITSEDGFRMRPGFTNFERVESGQALAVDSRGDVLSPMEGRLIMPLYQVQGDEGFFLARQVSIFWLRLSAFMRRLRFDKLAGLLPGVHRHPRKTGWMLVDPGIARWFNVEIFHLLGFRRHEAEGKYLVFSRRKHDRNGLRASTGPAHG